jgi:hypothetical protein
MSLYERLVFFKDPALGALLAFMVATAVLALLRRRQASALPLALGTGFLAGQVALCGWPTFPPHDAVQRLFYLVFTATIASSVRGGRGRWVVYFLFLGAAWAYLIPAPVRSAWTTPEAAAWLLGFAAAALAFGFCATDLAERQAGPYPLLLLFSLAVTTAVVLGLSHSALLGQLGGVCGAALLPAVIAAWRSPLFGMRANAVLLSAVLLPGLWIVHLFTTEAPPLASLALLATAPVVAWLAQRIGQSRPGVLAAPLLPIAASLGLVVASVLPYQDEAGGYSPSATESSRLPRSTARTDELVSPASFAEDVNPFQQWTEADKK